MNISLSALIFISVSLSVLSFTQAFVSSSPKIHIDIHVKTPLPNVSTRNQRRLSQASDRAINPRTYLDILSSGSAILRQIKDGGSKRKLDSELIKVERTLGEFFTRQKIEHVTSTQSKTYPQKLEDEVDESSTCRADIQKLNQGIQGQRPWALQMIDAAGKPGSGILRSLPPIHYPGNFDECMAAEPETDFQGRYCHSYIWVSQIFQEKLDTTLAFRFGLCMPSTCNSTEVEEFLNENFEEQKALLIARATLTECQERELSLSTKAIAVMVICSLFAALMLIATIYDVLYLRCFKNSMVQTETSFLGMDDQTIESTTFSTSSRRVSEHAPLVENERRNSVRAPDIGPGLAGQIFLSFSVYTNACKLLSTHRSAGSIHCIHGIRFISMTWVILGHTVVMGLRAMDNIRPYLDTSINRWTFQAILNALVSVDTFFAVSGLLLTYLVLKELERKKASGKFFANFYFHRFWRLTPPYMLVLMTYVPLAKYFSDGPMWPQSGIEKDECEDTWWTNLLYINNIVKDDQMCMAWSWYLANDMQFYVISPLIFLPMYFFNSLLAAFAFLLGTAISAGAISSVNDLGPSLDLTQENEGDFFSLYYIKPYCRMGPYIIGMLTGYILHRQENRPRIVKPLVVIGWMVAAVMALAALYGLYDHHNGEPLSTRTAAVYNALHRTSWAISVCWVIFACFNGYGGFANTFLSWKALIPLSRLTYCAYLVHPLVIMFFYLSQRKLFYMDNINLSYAFLACTVLSYAVAFVAFMAYEAPMMGMEKAVKNRREKTVSLGSGKDGERHRLHKKDYY